MKFTTLLLAVACAVGFSSCCCQSQPMPKLRPMPNCGMEQPELVGNPEAPVKVFDTKGK